MLVQAESGLVAVSGAPGAWGRIGVSICDITAGMNALIGVRLMLLLPASLKRFGLVRDQIHFLGNYSLAIITVSVHGRFRAADRGGIWLIGRTLGAASVGSMTDEIPVRSSAGSRHAEAARSSLPLSVYPNSAGAAPIAAPVLFSMKVSSVKQLRISVAINVSDDAFAAGEVSEKIRPALTAFLKAVSAVTKDFTSDARIVAGKAREAKAAVVPAAVEVGKEAVSAAPEAHVSHIRAA